MEKSDGRNNLESLRRDVLLLPGSGDRKDALKAIAELEAIQRSPDIQVLSKKASLGSEREGISFAGSRRLLTLLKSADPVIRKLAIEEIRSRYDNEEKLVSSVKIRLKNPLYQDRISKMFRYRKYAFRSVTMLLILIAAFVGSNALAWGWPNDISVAGIVLGFMTFYWLTGHLLWRCPACGYKLGFWPTYGRNRRMLRSSLKACPQCDASFS